jgi:hypothetical protein
VSVSNGGYIRRAVVWRWNEQTIWARLFVIYDDVERGEPTVDEVADSIVAALVNPDFIVDFVNDLENQDLGENVDVHSTTFSGGWPVFGEVVDAHYNNSDRIFAVHRRSREAVARV